LTLIKVTTAHLRQNASSLWPRLRFVLLIRAPRARQCTEPIMPERGWRRRGGMRTWREEHSAVDWQSIDTAPFGQDLQLSVIEDGEVHALVFPCRRTDGGWLRDLTKQMVSVRPTHWRAWQSALLREPALNAGR
jgi:hypothetical protein